jgi:hypothetical protein
MLVLLLAFQLATTNCTPTAYGGLNCMTTDLTPPPIPNDDWGLAAAIERGRQNHRNKTVGQMLASGDCAGAEKYALDRGDFPLVGTVRAYCAQAGTAVAQTPAYVVQAPAAPAAPAYAGPRKVRAKTRSGYCLDVPPDYVGTGAENSPAVTTALPRCDQLSAH